MISLAHSSLWIFGVSFHIPESLSPSLEILRIIPKKQTYKWALQRIYLERGSVHACILSCTRGYTVVYTRVYSSLLGRRYSLGISILGYRYFCFRCILLDDLALALWWFHASALFYLSYTPYMTLYNAFMQTLFSILSHPQLYKDFSQRWFG